MLLESDSKVGCATQAAQDGMDDSPRRLEKQPLFEPPPSIEDVTVALQDLCKLLHPRRKSWLGYLRFVGDDQLQSCMEQMKMLLGHYTQLESNCCGLGIRAPPSKVAVKMDTQFPGGPTCPSIQSDGRVDKVIAGET
ncbi:hypothetical protein C8Q72DRAFT_795102 [Fomitopsis betulina]|nr:hypothetical protein C8Q72DRAFT_795102 [Fomitopsis betulina]